MATYKELKNTSLPLMNAEQITEYIRKKGRGNSQLTADMFISAARKYNVPVQILLVMAAYETGMGTSNLAKQNKNALNVGVHMGDSNRTNRVMQDWQVGIDAAAELLSKRYGLSQQNGIYNFIKSNGRRDDGLYYALNKDGTPNMGYGNYINTLLNEIGAGYSNLNSTSNTKTYTIDKKWKWGIASNYRHTIRDQDKIHDNIKAYLSTLPEHLQRKVLATSANDRSHSENSRHYRHRAIDLRFDKELYDYMLKDTHGTGTFGITVLDANHGSAPHIHISYGLGGEEASKYAVTKNPFNKANQQKYGFTPIDLTGKTSFTYGGANTQVSFDTDEEGWTPPSEKPREGWQYNGEDYSYMLATQNALLQEKLKKEEEQKVADAYAAQLAQRQKERDFLVAQTLATKLPTINYR